MTQLVDKFGKLYITSCYKGERGICLEFNTGKDWEILDRDEVEQLRSDLENWLTKSFHMSIEERISKLEKDVEFLSLAFRASIANKITNSDAQIFFEKMEQMIKDRKTKGEKC